MIPNWLMPWWNWGCDLTALFNWDAVGAVGGIGVLWLAVREAQAGRRLLRQRAIMQLTRYWRLAHAEVWAVRNRVLRSNAKQLEAQNVRREMDRRGTKDALGAFNVDDFPTLQTAEAASHVPHALATVELFLDDLGAGRPGAEQGLTDALDWLEKLLRDIKAEADRNRLSVLTRWRIGR